MRPDSNEQYKKLYENYSNPDEEYMKWSIEITRIVRSIIEEVSFEFGLGEELRFDAKYFLLVNYDNMFLKPLGLQRGKENSDSLYELIRKDIRIILHSINGPKKISSHQILSAIDSNWKHLNVANIKFWENDGGMG
jgi:hypothetical protein